MEAEAGEVEAIGVGAEAVDEIAASTSLAGRQKSGILGSQRRPKDHQV